MIPENVEQHHDGVTILYKIISRHSWDKMQALHKSCPGSTVEHVMEGTGIYVLHLPPGGAEREETAA